MIFIALTFIAAFSIEILGTLVSVIGLSTIFGANPIIIAMAIAFDMGKLVVVSLLYTYWGELNRVMKGYALLAAMVTMIITSGGAAGYLSNEFQQAIVGTQEVSLKVDVLKQEQTKLEARKKQIDDQIANLPANYSHARVVLMKQFQTEQTQITNRLAALDKELPDAQVKQITVEAHAGPILYISKAFNVPVEIAVKYVIALIIFVFDPLAVFLIISGNFLLHQRRLKKEHSIGEADLFTTPEEDPPHRPKPPPSRTELESHVPTAPPPVGAVDEPGFGNSRVSFNGQAPMIPRAQEPMIQEMVPSPNLKLDMPVSEPDEFAEVAEVPPEDLTEQQYTDLPRSQSPEIKMTTPDASEAKVYTREDLIAAGVPDELLVDAGMAPATTPEREQITLSSLGKVKADPATITDVRSAPAGDSPSVGTSFYRTATRR